MEDHRYAGFWVRVAASLIDSLIFFVALLVPLSFIFGGEFGDAESVEMGTPMLLLQYVIPIVVTVWFWVKYLGTPGKMLLKIQVVDAQTGQALSTPQAIGRYLGYYVSIIPLLLGLIWVAFDKKKQGFHDKLAGTVVIYNTNN